MALVLDATAGGANANSYVTQARADALLEATPFATAWAIVGSGTKDACLVHATSVLDIEFDWQASRTDLTTPQALEWPRTGVYIYDRGTISSSEIPLEIERATAHLAFHYSQLDDQPETEAGVKSIELPAVKLAFKESQIRQAEAIPDLVRAMIRKLLAGSMPANAVGGSFPLERA